MEDWGYQEARGLLAPLLDYLEEWQASLGGAWEKREVPESLPTRLGRIFENLGHLEGMRLKSQGLLSQEVEAFIRTLSPVFGAETQVVGPFKLPFLGAEFRLRYGEVNLFRHRAWLLYHQTLLSAYALRPLRFQALSPMGPEAFEHAVRLEEAPVLTEQAPALSEAAHRLNNQLAGILSFASLMLAEDRYDGETAQRLALIRESALKAAEIVKKLPG